MDLKEHTFGFANSPQGMQWATTSLRQLVPRNLVSWSTPWSLRDYATGTLPRWKWCPRINRYAKRERALSRPQRSARPALIATLSPEATARKKAAERVAVGKRLSSNEIRAAFLEFYQQRGHRVVPSASLVPDDPTILLTIAGMVPFKPIFLGQRQPPDPPRAVSAQRCLRTNDIENVGRTKRHHTFFEMLGNFSFGDYFKEQSIRWAWELITEVYGIPRERLCVSVLHADQEAYEIWRDVVGLPEHRIVRMSETDNFWSSGPTGPCGPCSEVYYDFKPELGTNVASGGHETSVPPATAGTGILDLNDDERFIELYNLVFMEFNRDTEGRLMPLQARNIDTGMGLERIAQVLQGVPNNYETDLMRPLLDKTAELAGRAYASLSERERVSAKIVADHARAVVHLLADGVQPSNLGRGYVLRRLIRRMVRHGRQLGIEQAFTEVVAGTAVALAADAGYLHVAEHRARITRELQMEEVRFRQTLERGEALLAELLRENRGHISGEDAFELYDTYGFPVEMTQEIAAEQGLQIDMDAFQRCMEAQRARARERGRPGSIDLPAESELVAQLGGNGTAIDGTEFVGYEQEQVATARIVALIVDGKAVQSLASVPEGSLNKVQVILDRTPFYAEGGGQVADTGELQLVQREPRIALRVADVQQLGNAWIHTASLDGTSADLHVGDVVTARIDAARRRRIRAHHTGTHLLQAALRQVLGADQVAQAGSLVDSERLRFDFTAPRALTDRELELVSELVNQWIDEAHPLIVEHLPYPEAVQRGAIAMFGEKYGDVVRVVNVPGVSMELCGGTHVRNTAEVGLFHVLSESSISSGVRRIEAICGQAARDFLNQRDLLVRTLQQTLRVTQSAELVARAEALLNENKLLERQAASARTELAKALAMRCLPTQQLRQETGKPVALLIKRLDQVDAVGTALGSWDHDILGAAADAILSQLGDRGIVVLAAAAAPSAQQVIMVGRCTPLVASETPVHMGRLLQAAAKRCRGGGGGKPTQAQAGGRDATSLDAALAALQEEVSRLLQGS